MKKVIEKWNYNVKPLLPISIKINAFTSWVGSPCKSKKQQQKQDRINKIRKLEGKKPNVTLPNDSFDGLISVKPMSAPRNELLFVDFKYDKWDDKF